jgi:hypothetical protein
LPVLLLPTAAKTTYVANEKWQVFIPEGAVPRQGGFRGFLAVCGRA